MPSIVHFELPADDAGRARQFWSSLFGWEWSSCVQASALSTGAAFARA